MNLLSQSAHRPLAQENQIASFGYNDTTNAQRSQSSAHFGLTSKTSSHTIPAPADATAINNTSLTLISSMLKELMATLSLLLEKNNNPAVHTPHQAPTPEQSPAPENEHRDVIVPAVVAPRLKEEAGVQETYLSAKRNGEKPNDIWGGLFFESFDTLYLSNPHSSHVAGIKLAMQKFGQSPTDIYKEVTPLSNGFTITMRDNFKLHITFDELALAQEGCQMLGDEDMLKDAVFLFAALVKRKQLESSDSAKARSFAISMVDANNGEPVKTVLELLGLKDYIKPVKSQDIATTGGLGVIVKSTNESLAIIDGMADFFSTPSAVRKYQPAYVLN